ncbi:MULTISPECIES: LacI family DNA-binding transcriptional regulator [unclassified Lentimonas]|uniref:LacI family DNA-binding transcriptional regulator n=1 Tax=unclassified Lentimonas TaxID=2630993 RepID=UPI001389F977|nr:MULTISPECIES: LacI family DNA-binding transcriptional regulator [unclassified Lentimonas]
MKSKISMQSVASKAGVSRMTVSLALRNDPRISEKTRARIVKIADELGYKPDPKIQRLIGYLRDTNLKDNHCTVAYIDSVDSGGLVIDSYLHRLRAGMKARAADVGIALEQIDLRKEDYSAARLQQILVNRGISGVIVLPPAESFDELKSAWEPFPLVLGVSRPTAVQAHRVITDNFSAMSLAVKSVLARGFKRPCLVTNVINEAHQAYQNTAAFVRTLQVNEASSSAEMIFYLDHRAPSVEQDRIFCEGVVQGGYDVVIVDVCGAGYSRIRQLLAQCASVATCDMNLNHTISSASGVDRNPERIGAIMVEQLYSAIQHNHKGMPSTPTTTAVCGEWFDGDSLSVY